MANLGQVKIEWGDESHTVTLKTIHTVWAEEALGESSDKMPAMRLTYAMVWQALVKSGADIPGDFNEWLLLEPDLEQIEINGDEGKGGKVPNSG